MTTCIPDCARALLYYLARIADAGVDILYVLTARRREGDWLGEDGSAMLSAFFALPDALQAATLAFVTELGRKFPR